MIERLLEAVGLKALPRAGWVRKGIAQPESVAAHSWGVAWLTLVLLPSSLNRERALIYAILHDLPEVRTGDFTPHDGVTKVDKLARERTAMLGLVAGLPHDLFALWEQYEAQADPEAQFVKQLDRLDMALQAVAYAADAPADLEEFLDSAAAGIVEPELRALMVQLRRIFTTQGSASPETGPSESSHKAG